MEMNPHTAQPHARFEDRLMEKARKEVSRLYQNAEKGMGRARKSCCRHWLPPMARQPVGQAEWLPLMLNSLEPLIKIPKHF